MLRILLAITIVVTLTGCPSTNTQYLTRPDEIKVTGLYTHSPSAMNFPLTVDEYRRVGVHRFDVQGLHVSAGYNLYAPPKLVIATVYIYPSASIVSIGSPPEIIETARTTLCKNEYEARKQEIVNAHPGAKLLKESNVQPPGADKMVSGMSAIFEYEGMVAGVHQPLQSRLDLYCYVEGEWTIKYRFTYPRDFDAMQSINEFMQRLLWPKSS